MSVCMCVCMYICMCVCTKVIQTETGKQGSWRTDCWTWPGAKTNSDHWEVQWCASKPAEASNSKTTPSSSGLRLQGVNARRHAARHTVKQIQDFKPQVLSCPPHSPDLAPSDFHLFWPLKVALFGRNLKSETCNLRLQGGLDIEILNRHGMWETWRAIRTTTLTGSIFRAKRWWNSWTRCHSYVPHLIQNVAAHLFRNTGLSYTDLCLAVIYECHDSWWLCARCNEDLLSDRSASFVILLWRLLWVELYQASGQPALRKF